MNAYDLSEKKNKIINRIGYLKSEMNNETGTVLLTNDEVEDLTDCMKECVDLINLELAKIKVF